MRRSDAAERDFFHGSPAEALPRLREAAAEAPRAGWLLGAALGALGRYGEAKAQLMDVFDGSAPARYRSLAASTLASHHRQLGRHADAREWDERAAALAGNDSEAIFDARLGLAADAVGVNDLAAARAELAAARAELTTAGADLAGTKGTAGAATRRSGQRGASPTGEGTAVPQWRRRVRVGWVETEIALLAGDPSAAVPPARAGLAVAEAAAAPRHVAKCLLFLGASLHVAAGAPDPAAVAALEQAAKAATDLGALPLSWVAEVLLAEQADLRGRMDFGLRHRRAAASAIIEIGAGLPPGGRNQWLGRGDIAAIVALST